MRNRRPDGLKDLSASPPVYITTPAPVYDANDNITTSTAPNGAVTTAVYDDADQLSHTHRSTTRETRSGRPRSPTTRSATR